MRKSIILSAIVAVTALSACTNDPYSPANNAAVRTIGGAAAGAVIADATGGSKTQGALIGAVAGGVSCVTPGVVNCN